MALPYAKSVEDIEALLPWNIKKTVQTTLSIIETFSKIRELSRTVNELSTIDDKKDQKSLMQRSGELIAEILDDDLQTSEEEATIELNFAKSVTGE